VTVKTTIARARSAGAIADAPLDHLPPLVRLLLTVEIVATYTVIRPLMPRRDIRALVSLSRRVRYRMPVEPAGELRDPWRVALRLGNAVDRVLSVLPTDSRCLVQSLVLTRLLTARGIPSKLVIGAHSTPHFEAHAWVEYQGRPVLPPGDFLDSRLHEL
jgi:hypothetical protein